MSEEKVKDDIKKLDIGLNVPSLLRWIDETTGTIRDHEKRLQALEANLKEAKETETEEEEDY